MDLNLRRRKNELDIADQVADQLLHAVPLADAPVATDIIAHHFGVVCQNLNYTPDSAAVGRILGYVVRAMKHKQQRLDRAVRTVNQAADHVESNDDRAPRSIEAFDAALRAL